MPLESSTSPPSKFDLREKLLNQEYGRTKTLLDEREEQKIKLGYTIMTGRHDEEEHN